MEIYLNGEEDSDLQHYFQEGVMRTVIDNIDKVLSDPGNISARSHLQWAATCAINGWASPGDAWTPIHQIGHVLTALYKVPHGASLAILMPAWMEYMYPRRMKQYHRFARNVMLIPDKGKTEEETVREGIAAFREFLKPDRHSPLFERNEHSGNRDTPDRGKRSESELWKRRLFSLQSSRIKRGY